jgi:hypothetical protein
MIIEFFHQTNKYISFEKFQVHFLSCTHEYEHIHNQGTTF